MKRGRPESRIRPRRSSAPAGSAQYAWNVRERQGVVSLSGPGGVPLLDRFWTELELDSGDVLTTCQSGLFSAGPGRWTSDLANGRIAVELKIERSIEPAGVLVSVRIANRGTGPLGLRQVRVVRAEAGGRIPGALPSGEWRILRMGYAQGGAHREDPDGRMSALVSLAAERVTTRSWGQAAVRFRGAGEGLLIGFLTSEKQLAWLDFEKDRSEMAVAAACETEGREIPPGGAVDTEVLYVGWHRDLAAGLREYAAACARRMGVKLRAVPTGWSSAHSLPKDGVGEDAVIRQADFLAARRAALPLEVVQVDDGYAPAYGDWLEPAPRFPHGLEWLAGRIRERGCKPGLWVAPFVAQASSALFKAHPEWMVRDREDRPLPWDVEWSSPREPWYALDGSLFEVRRWLQQLFAALRRFGFAYFKLDFLFMGCLKGVRSRPGTRVEAYRAALAAIRAGARDAYLLGAAAPASATVGLVDGIRASHDVTAEGLPAGFREASRETHQRGWAHGALWNTDHDAVVARDLDGAGPETGRALAASVALSGGAFFSGDFLPELPEDRLAIVTGAAGNGSRKRLAGGEAAALALDLLEREYPRVLARPLGRGRYHLGVFNHADTARTLVVDLKRLGVGRAVVRRIAEGGPVLLGRSRGRFLTPPVPPHGCVELLVEAR